MKKFKGGGLQESKKRKRGTYEISGGLNIDQAVLSRGVPKGGSEKKLGKRTR